MDYEAEITQLEDAEVHGYYGQNDADLWARALALITDPEVSDAIAIRAVRVIDGITGETSDIEAEGGIAKVREVTRSYMPRA